MSSLPELLQFLGALGFLFIIIGGIVAVIYYFQLMILAFQASPLWGLCYIFLPAGALFFVINHWRYKDVREVALNALAGIAVSIGGLLAYAFLHKSLAE